MNCKICNQKLVFRDYFMVIGFWSKCDMCWAVEEMNYYNNGILVVYPGIKDLQERIRISLEAGK